MISTAHELRNLAVDGSARRSLSLLGNRAAAATAAVETASPDSLQVLGTHPVQDLQSLLARPEFRETGRALGTLLNSSPLLRYGVPFCGLLAVGSLGLHGAVDTLEGLASGRDGQALSGMLRTGAAAGFLLAPQNPASGAVGLALLGADYGLHRAEGAHAGRIATAATMAAAGVGGVVGGIGIPLGLTWAGYQVAGPIGGIAGLVTGALVGHQIGSEAGARLALAF